MKRPLQKIFVLILAVLIYSGCNLKPEIEKLPLSVSINLNYLQENPQFVMYMNFKNMKRSDFWKKHVSDSLLNAEKDFGSLLHMFNNATGASISNGLDELYYSNSWAGENAIVMKGIFDLNRLQNYIENDSAISVIKYADGTNIYVQEESTLYFFFKDNFTLCASNYRNQLDAMISLNENDTAGISLNKDLLKVINDIQYKDNLWMVTTEKTFIRGVFLNFLNTNTGEAAAENDSTAFPGEEGYQNSHPENQDNNLIIDDIYQKLNSISFSAKMKDDLDFVVQADCIDHESAEHLSSLVRGMIAFSKISSAVRDRGSYPSQGILDKVKIETINNELFLNIKVTDDNIDEFRKASVLNAPPQ